MKMTRTHAGLMLACVATLAAFATGALDPLLHLLGLSPDSPLALLMLANGPGAITTTKTIGERIAEFTAKRAELVDKKNALVDKAIVVEGRTFDEAEAEQNAAFEADIKTIDTTLAQLKSHEAIVVAKASPVVQGSGAGQGAVQIQGSGPISVVRNLPQGTAYTRYVMCLAAAKGKVVYVDFWASWCGPCRDEMPEFMQLQNQYRDKGVQFVGIAADNPQAAADFARKLGINYPVLQGEETALEMMPLAGNSFGGLPYTFIANREGKIVATAPGRISKKRLEAALQPLLTQK